MKIFIDAEVVTRAHLSGIGHTCLNMLRALDEVAARERNLFITAIIPLGKQTAFGQYGFSNIRVRTSWPWGGLLNVLARIWIPVPVDLWFGRGTYVFPDYRNWFTPFSRSVTFVYDVAFKIHPNTVDEKNRRYLERNMPRWLRRTSRIACISKAAALEFQAAYPMFADKVHTVYLGVDPASFRPRRPAEVANVLRKYELPTQYFLCVGNIEPRKNLLVLLDAYKHYADKRVRPIPLVLVGGDGWNNEAILRRLHELQGEGYAILRPKKYVADDDLPALYSGAWALVHIALHEGFGLPPVQAQACGTPVIVSDLPVFHETLPEERTTFVAANDTEGVARALAEQTKRPHHVGYAPLTWANAVATLLRLVRG